MKFTIEGFSQQRAVELGLTAEDLVILRWFVDFWPSPDMVKMEHDGKTYALVSYAGFIKQMPIIGCNKRTIARKFQRLVEAQVLENVTIKQGGSFSVYRFGTNYDSLVHKSATVVQKRTEGMNKDGQPPMYENVQPKTNLIKSNNPSNTNIMERPAKRFTPPTVFEVADYCRERNNTVNPEMFVSYYESIGWMVGKTHMKDWKAAVRTWERRERERAAQKPQKFDRNNPDYEHDDPSGYFSLEGF